MSKFLTSIYTSSLRSFLRNIGLISLLGIVSNIKTRWRHFQYDKTRPSTIDVHVNGCQSTMLVRDQSEYVRVLSVHQDRHIISELIKNLQPGESCWDIGSNIGLYSILLGKAVGDSGKVYAFEPEEQAFERLRQNIEFNKLRNISPQKIALGQKNKKMRLKVNGHYSSGTHTLVAVDTDGDKSIYEDVDVVTGDGFRAEKNIEVPVAIKIDVEGAEEEVLLGLRKTIKDKRCRMILCEIHFSILASSGRKDAPLRIIELLKECELNNIKWLDPSHLVAKRYE